MIEMQDERDWFKSLQQPPNVRRLESLVEAVLVDYLLMFEDNFP